MIQILALVALSSVKHFWTVPIVVVAGYSYWETIFINNIGGLAGFFIFYYIGELKIVKHYFGLLMLRIFKVLGFNRKSKEKKKFTRRNRFIVAVKGKYGLIGLSFLTPVLLSIPLGSLLAARYYDEDRRTIPFMILSILFWSFSFTSVLFFF
jgi:hypothetical protein